MDGSKPWYQQDRIPPGTWVRSDLVLADLVVCAHDRGRVLSGGVCICRYQYNHTDWLKHYEYPPLLRIVRGPTAESLRVAQIPLHEFIGRLE